MNIENIKEIRVAITTKDNFEFSYALDAIKNPKSIDNEVKFVKEILRIAIHTSNKFLEWDGSKDE